LYSATRLKYRTDAQASDEAVGRAARIQFNDPVDAGLDCGRPAKKPLNYNARRGMGRFLFPFRLERSERADCRF